MSFFYKIIQNITSPLTWILQSIGFFSKEVSLVILGLDNVGKTTLLHMLIHDKLRIHNPTIHPNTNTVKIGNTTFNAHDLGGHESARRLWRQYYMTIDCIVFIVDSTDYARMGTTKKELSEIIVNMPNIPIVVLGNKIDAEGACSETQLKSFLGIEDNNPSIKVFMCSIVKRAGIYEPFKWLNKNL